MKKIGVICYLATLFITQGCVVYQKVPIRLNEALDKGEILVVSTQNDSLYYKNITYKNENYYVEQLNGDIIAIDSSQVSYVHLGNQEEGANIIAVEFLGEFYAGFGVKYEKVVYQNKFLQLLPKVGIGMNVMMGFGPPVALIGASAVLGRGDNKIAFGGNYLFGHNFPMVNMEYRYQKKGRGTFFSLGISYSLEGGQNYFLPALSLGTTF